MCAQKIILIPAYDYCNVCWSPFWGLLENSIYRISAFEFTSCTEAPHRISTCERWRMDSPPWSPFVHSESRRNSQWDATQRRSRNDLHGSILRYSLNKQQFYSHSQHTRIQSRTPCLWGGGTTCCKLQKQEMPHPYILGRPLGFI